MKWQASYFVKVELEGDESNEVELLTAVFNQLRAFDLDSLGGTVTGSGLQELESYRIIDGRPVPVDSFYERPRDPQAVTDTATAIFVQPEQPEHVTDDG